MDGKLFTEEPLLADSEIMEASKGMGRSMTTKTEERLVVAAFWLFVAGLTAWGTYMWGLWPVFGRIVDILGGTFEHWMP